VDFHHGFSDILNNIFGDPEKLSLEQRCVIGICFFSAMSMFLGLFLNIVMSMPVEIVITVFGFGILFSFFYYRSRYKGGAESLFWPLFISGCLFCTLSWKYNSGLSGSPTIIAIMVVVIIATISKRKQRVLTSSLILLLIALLLIIEYHYPGLVIEYSSRRNKFIDNFITFCIAVLIAVLIINYIMTGYQIERRKVQTSYEKLKEQSDSLRVANKKLNIALLEVKQLSGLLPICASCKKIRDDKGYWNQIETYLKEHSEAEFSHGMCPECLDRTYGDQDWYQKKKEE
jgi:hypothetical protein